MATEIEGVNTEIATHPDDDLSLAEHEAKYNSRANGTVAPAADAESDPVPESPQDAPESPESDDQAEKAQRARDEKGRFLKASQEPPEAIPTEPHRKHRAEKDKATPADVPRIRALTDQVRQRDEAKASTEAENAELRLRLERLEQAQSSPRPSPPPVQASPPPDDEPVYDRPEPQLEEFAGYPDPYQAHLRALVQWDREREAYIATFKHQKAAAAKQVETWQQAYEQRAKAFAESHPDFNALMGRLRDVDVSPLLAASITLDEQGPALLYTLLQSPALLDELNFLTHGKDVNEGMVQRTRRLLASRAQSVVTGSDASPARTTPVAPDPLNPVRTGPTKPDARLLSDAASLRDHEAAYHRRRR